MFSQGHEASDSEIQLHKERVKNTKQGKRVAKRPQPGTQSGSLHENLEPGC